MVILRAKKKDAFNTFLDQCTSRAMRQTYPPFVKQYKRWIETNAYNGTEQSWDSLLPDNDNKDDIATTLKNWGDFLLDYKKSKPKSVWGAYCGVNKFYFANGIDFSVNQLKRIMNIVGEKPISQAKAYTHDHIKRLLDFTNGLKYKVVIFVLSACGFRPEVVNKLTLGHLTDMKKEGFDTHGNDIYRIGPIRSKGRWVPFSYTTPECSHMINAYLNYREDCKEVLDWGDPDDRDDPNRWDKVHGSPLIRDGTKLRDMEDEDIKHPNFLSDSRVKDELGEIARNSGVSKPQPNQDTLSIRQRRNEIPAAYGLRKFFDTQFLKAMQQVGITDKYKELLLGHDIGLDKHYLDRPQVQQEVLNEYMKVIPYLTISQENKYKLEAEEAQAVAIKAMSRNEEFQERKRKFLRDNPDHKDEL